jgi:hypothetical protein
MVNEPVLVLPLVWTFSVDLFPQILQNFPAVKLINHLACRKEFMMNIALTVKEDQQQALDVQHDLPRSLWMWRGWAFPLIVEDYHLFPEL